MKLGQKILILEAFLVLSVFSACAQQQEDSLSSIEGTSEISGVEEKVSIHNYCVQNYQYLTSQPEHFIAQFFNKNPTEVWGGFYEYNLHIEGNLPQVKQRAQLCSLFFAAKNYMFEVGLRSFDQCNHIPEEKLVGVNGYLEYDFYRPLANAQRQFFISLGEEFYSASDDIKACSLAKGFEAKLINLMEDSEK